MSAYPTETAPLQRVEFFRQLQQMTTRIHATRNVDEIMLGLSGEICALFGADRLTIYVLGEDKASMVSKVKTGLTSFNQLKLPISAQSVAGYAALSRQLLNLRDVYDDNELKAWAPELRFQQGVDKRTGYRTQQMLVAPIIHDGDVVGVVQLINNQRGGAFSDTIVEGARHLCDTLAIAFAQRHQAPTLSRTRFTGAIRESVLARAQVEQAVRVAESSARDIEDVLLDDFNLKVGALGRALADYFAVPYLGFHPERRKPVELLKGIDRAFALEQQWLPIEENRNGLYILCTDPESARHNASVAQLFPSAKPVYCVTTRREFGWMVNQCFGPPPVEGGAALAPDAALTPARQDELVKAVAGLVAGSHQHGLSDLRIETAPGDAPGEIRFTVSGVLKLG